MVSRTVYLSYPPEKRDHAQAIGTIVSGLGYSYVESSPQSRSAANTCGILLRIRTHAYTYDSTILADTRAFLSDGRSPADGRIVDLILAPGYTVWPEKAACPILYVNAVTQAYPDWVRDLQHALVGALAHMDESNPFEGFSAVDAEVEGQYDGSDLEDVEYGEYGGYDDYSDDERDFEDDAYEDAGFLEFPDDF